MTAARRFDSLLVVCAGLAACCAPAKPTTPAGPAGPMTPAPPPAPAPARPQPEANPQPEVPVTSPTVKVTQTAAPQELVFPDEAFRKQQPKAGPPRPFRLPPVKPFQLRNGIHAYLVEQHELPIVSIDLSFDGGSMTDPKGKEGLASVCMAMLTEGTERLDKIQYAEALADVASNINTYATDDAMGLTLSSLRKHLGATFALFAETLLSPGLRASDFDRMVKRRIEGVKQARGTPAAVAARVTPIVQYGPDHPFAGVVTEASLGAITLDDCRQLVSAYTRPGNARLFIVGDLTEAEARAYFDKGALAAWKGAAPKLAALPAPKAPAGRIFFVDVPGAAQSQVSLLHGGPQRTAPDYFANTMMAAVLGGGFTSRVNMNLREEKGYSYGARGGFGYTKQYGLFNASASVQADATYQSVLELAREVKDLASGARPVHKEELEREKQGAILGLPSQFATAQAALGNYRRLVYFGLPLDYYNSYVARVGQVNEAQVKASAAQHLRPAQAAYLVVGDGNAKVIVGVEKKEVDPDTKKEKTLWTREPYMKDGKQLTLREALAELAARGDVGVGGLVELDRDGRPKSGAR
jgi:zinc protease